MLSFKEKYLKYKNKYLNLKYFQYGGAVGGDELAPAAGAGGGGSPREVQVIIIPEEHSVKGQLKNFEMIPNLQTHILKFLKIKDTEILCYSEGDEVNTFFNFLYSLPDESGNTRVRHPKLYNLQHVKEYFPDDLSYNCFKHGLKLINLILNTLDLYKEIRILTPHTILTGLSNKPMDKDYIMHLLFKEYSYTQYIPDEKHKFYEYVNLAYMNIINNQSIDEYESYIIQLLNECRPFLNKCSDYFDYNSMIDEYISSGTIKNRKKLYYKYSSLLRSQLDKRIINQLTIILRKHPKIKLLIMNCGANHFYNLIELIKSSSLLKMEPMFLKFIYNRFDEEGDPVLRNGPSNPDSDGGGGGGGGGSGGSGGSGGGGRGGGNI
jgi:uncharacterized membrane protein YgcG